MLWFGGHYVVDESWVQSRVPKAPSALLYFWTDSLRYLFILVNGSGLFIVGRSD